MVLQENYPKEILKKISTSSYARSAAKLPTDVVVLLIKLYRKFISPMFPPSCRFYPSCSSYAIDAFREHGFFRGMLLSAWRILRCNPFGRGGYDPVPHNPHTGHAGAPTK